MQNTLRAIIFYCALLLVFFCPYRAPIVAHADEGSIILTIPSLIAASSAQAMINSYSSFQECLWKQGEICDEKYNDCIAAMNERAVTLGYICGNELARCVGECGTNSICISFCDAEFRECTAENTEILMAMQRTCNSELEDCYDKVVETCFDIPVSLTDLYPRWYEARK